MIYSDFDMNKFYNDIYLPFNHPKQKEFNTKMYITVSFQSK